jgi:hypothetical protein
MINKYVIDLASQMGIKLSKISLTDGKPLGCKDVSLLNITSQEHLISSLVFHSDLENLEIGVSCDRLEVRMRKALSHLQMKLKHETIGRFE